MTRTVKDAALLLQVIAGYDPRDPGSADTPVPDYIETLKETTSQMRLGILRDYFYNALDPEIERAMEAAFLVLKELTHTERDIGPLATDSTYSSVMDPYVTILKAEAYAYHKDYVAKSPELYQAQTLDRIQSGAEITASAYLQARRQLESIRRSVTQTFERVDLLITPTTCVPPFALTELLEPNTLRERELLTLRNTRPFDMLGLPTVSIPCGFSQAGLPIGLQITGPAGGEAAVLRLAVAYERATDWHKRRPSYD